MMRLLCWLGFHKHYSRKMRRTYELCLRNDWTHCRHLTWWAGYHAWYEGDRLVSEGNRDVKPEGTGGETK